MSELFDGEKRKSWEGQSSFWRAERARSDCRGRGVTAEGEGTEAQVQ